MKYFAIEHSLNEKVMGKIPQLKEVIYNCHIYDEPKFIDNYVFDKINTNPILANAILFSTAKQTDLLDISGSIGFSSGFLLSNKLKEIFDRFNMYGVQFFDTYIIQKKEKYDYWQAKIYDFPFQYIDFKKTSFILEDRDIDRNVFKKEIMFNTFNDFSDFINEIAYPKMIFFNVISFTPNIDLDYFSLRFTDAHKGIVSERLKNEIEIQNCTGIEFRPIEINLNEWLKRDGHRDQIYGRSW